MSTSKPQETKDSSEESSIYKRFKMNSHKILIESPQQTTIKDARKNKKLELIKKNLSKINNSIDDAKTGLGKSSFTLLSNSLEEIPERSHKLLSRSKESSGAARNLKDIEQRILLKMKNTNKTDRKDSGEDFSKIVKKHQHHINNRYLKSPGSDKAENLFPQLANSSMTSAYSTPYGKGADKETDLVLGMNKEQIADAMSKIK